MSVASWKQEFYSVPAREAAATTEMALLHAYKKWQGFTRENLDKHNIKKDEELDKIYPSVSNCALCVKFYKKYCAKCPLDEAWGNPCFMSHQNGAPAPYYTYIHTSNPYPMLRLLKRALKAYGLGDHIVKRASAKEGGR